MKEVWKTIDGFDDMYGVSDHGSVKNLITEHVLTQKPDKDGYMIFEVTYPETDPSTANNAVNNTDNQVDEWSYTGG